MSELVHNHMVDYEHRRLDEAPVERNVVTYRAGPPPVTVIYYPGRDELDTELACMSFRAREDRFLGARDIPIPQNLTALSLMAGGYRKPIRELHLTGRGLNHVNAVIRSEIRG